MPVVTIRVPREWEVHHHIADRTKKHWKYKAPSEIVADDKRSSVRRGRSNPDNPRLRHNPKCLFYCEQHNISGSGYAMTRHKVDEHSI